MGGSKYFHLLLSDYVCGVLCESVTGMNTCDQVAFVTKPKYKIKLILLRAALFLLTRAICGKVG